jgi:hypothetical protein
MLGEDTHWRSKECPCVRNLSACLKQLAEVALTDNDILLVGSESNKRPYAEFVHQQSRRSKARFVSVNCNVIKGERPLRGPCASCAPSLLRGSYPSGRRGNDLT